MRLIADSGSSVCDWVLTFEGHTVLECTTMGFNPFFHNEVVIQYAIERSADLMKYADKVSHVHYYGAGCSSESRIETMRRALQFVFRNAKIEVMHDLDGAVYATLTEEPAIVCILGTGSNACYFDGQYILEKTFALGHVLGDEGSGAYFGKELLTKYLYNELPKHINDLLKVRHGLTKEVIFQNVYNMPHANVYLASFMKTLSAIKDDPFVQEFVYKGLSRFLTYHVWSYKQHKTVPTHFVGSIAYHFQDLLREACYKHRVTVGSIIERPVFNLATYHSRADIKDV